MILWFPMFVSSTNWVYLSITPEPDTSCRVFSDVQPPPKLSNWNPWVPQQFITTQQCWMRHQTRCITSAIDTMQRNQIFYSLTLRITLALLTLMWHLSSKAKIMWAWWRLLRLDNLLGMLVRKGLDMLHAVSLGNIVLMDNQRPHYAATWISEIVNVKTWKQNTSKHKQNPWCHEIPRTTLKTPRPQAAMAWDDLLKPLPSNSSCTHGPQILCTGAKHISKSIVTCTNIKLLQYLDVSNV